MQDIPKITLKQYITSYNYRKQLQSHSRSKEKNRIPKKTYLSVEGGPTVRSEPLIQKQVEIVKDDHNFAKFQKMMSELLRIFIREIESQRNSHNVLNSIMKMSCARHSPKASKIQMFHLDQSVHLPFQQSRMSKMPQQNHFNGSKFIDPIEMDLEKMKRSVYEVKPYLFDIKSVQDNQNSDKDQESQKYFDQLNNSRLNQKKIHFDKYLNQNDNKFLTTKIVNKNNLELKEKKIRGRKLYQRGNQL